MSKPLNQRKKLAGLAGAVSQTANRISTENVVRTHLRNPTPQGITTIKSVSFPVSVLNS